MRHHSVNKKHHKPAPIKHIGSLESKKLLGFAEKVTNNDPNKFLYFFEGLMNAGMKPTEIKDITSQLPRGAAQKVWGKIKPMLEE